MTGNVELIYFLMMGTCLIAGTVLVSEWRQFRESAAGWWSATFILGAAGASMTPLRQFPALDLITIGLGNALFIAAYGAISAGIAALCGRRPNLLAIAVPVVAWLLFYGFSPLADDFDTRVVVVALASAIISAAGALAGLSGPPSRLVRLLALWLVFRTVFFVGRAIWAAGAFGPLTPDARSFGLEVVIIEGLWTSVILGYAMLAILRERRESALIKLAETDFLTGADNRRAFQGRAKTILSEAARSGRTTTLLMLDLDNFKQINDAYGHDFGDQVLRQFASLVRSRLGPRDSFARLGGEEFAIMLPGRDEAEGRRIAESLRADFAEAIVKGGIGRIKATVSIGLTTTRRAGTLDDLLRDADEALYRAKTKGRNRVESGLMVVTAPPVDHPAIEETSLTA